jgi:hypothetical protein
MPSSDNVADDVDVDLSELPPIRGKVVQFFNDREIVMNVGKADGVKVGMRFAVLVPGGIEIPGEEGEPPLGTVDAAKTVVKVVRVDGDHLSVGRTFLVIKGRPAIKGQGPMDILYRQSTLAMLAGTQDLPAIPDRVETFDVKRADTLRAEVDMTVRKGDEVRLTTGDEFIFPG